MRVGPRRRARSRIAAALVALAAASAQAIDIESYWEYANPAASEARFRGLLEQAHGDDRLELLTQIARTYSLRRDFARAHQLLDDVEPQLDKAGPGPKVRYLLERGRTFNSAGEPQRARPLFEQAWDLARTVGLEGLAVDAAHMVAITWSGKPEAIDWNLRGLALARTSNDGKAQALVPALLNNSAWDLHDMGRCTEALPLFGESRDAWRKRGRPAQVRFAEYGIGRCLRLLDRPQQALAIQRRLEAEYAAAGETSGYVFEELAELLAAAGNTTDARPYFRRAAEELSKDPWLSKNEPQRLARLREKGQ